MLARPRSSWTPMPTQPSSSRRADRGGALSALLVFEEPREPRGRCKSSCGSHDPEGKGRVVQALRRRGAHRCPPLLGGVHAVRIHPRAPATLLLRNRGGSSPEAVHRAGLERARGDPPGQGTAERGGVEQRGEESECVPHLRESVRLRLRERNSSGEAGRGPRRPPDLPPISRGKGDREDLPRTEPRRIPDEDRAGLGQPNNCEHPQQPGLLRTLATERRDQAREARRANRDRDVQPSPERNAATDSPTGPKEGGYAPAPA